jgi:hypothetical protein
VTDRFSSTAGVPIKLTMQSSPRTPDELRTSGERRSRERFLYTWDQLLGRAPIYTRRRRDKQRLGAHLALVVLLVGLTLWWVVPLHTFAGPVLFTLTASHGVHAGDLPTVLFLAVAARSLLVVARRGRATAAH